MKTLTFIVVLVIGLLTTSCDTVHKYNESMTFKMIDSTNQYEDYMNPGTFKSTYDTIVVVRRDKGNYNRPNRDKTTYKIVKILKQYK